MAKVNNLILQEVSGALGKQVVVRTRGKKTFLSKYPDMSNVKPSEVQQKQRSKFSEAVEYARSIINDPIKKTTYKVKKGKSVYQTAIKEYMKSRQTAL